MLHDCIQKELFEVKISGVYALIQGNADIQNEVNKNILATLARIETQTIKTNGRVTDLENWKWKMIGISIGVASVIGLIFNYV